MMKKTLNDFQFAHNPDIVEIELTSDYSIIGVGCFHDCPNLTRVTLGPQIELVREGAFSSCPKLKSVIYSKHTQFEDHAFNNSGGLKTLTDESGTAKLFYFPVDKHYAITFYNKEKSTQDFDVYEGRFASYHYFPKGEIDQTKNPLYWVVINREGKEYSWFNDNISDAVVGAKFKASNKSWADFFGSEMTFDSRIGWGDFALFAGVCSMGIPLWNILIQYLGYSLGEKPTFGEVLETLNWFYPEMHARLVEMYQKQHTIFNWLDYGSFVSGYEFKEKFIKFLKENGKIVRIKSPAQS